MPITLNGDTGITTPSYGGVDVAEYLVPVTAFKNRIINGAMMIDQRNAGASVTVTSTAAVTFAVDRTYGYGSVASKFSMQRNAGSVTPPAGFSNYLGCTSLSSYSVGSSDLFVLGQTIEGLNVADLNWGTANAQTVTLSFWVRSSLTGTFGGALRNDSDTRSYPFTYTINSANTWEYKTITIAGDTTGTWLTTNGAGIKVIFGLGVGSALSGTAGSWAGASYQSATGATSVVGTNGATFYITGVQLEKGSTATSFDYRPYGTELALCQRYFQVFGNISGNGSTGGFNPIGQGQGVTINSAGQYSIFLPVSMRTVPSIGISTTASAFSVTSPTDGNTSCTSLPAANISGPNVIRVAAFCTTAGFMTAGAGNILFANSSTPAWVSASAEL